jgi:uncharacterized membrane protein
VAAFSVERLLVIFALASGSSLKSQWKLLSVLGLCLISLAIYSVLFVTTEEEISVTTLESSSSLQCAVSSNWYAALQKFMLFDLAVSMLLPFLVTLVANVAIAIRLYRDHKQVHYLTLFFNQHIELDFSALRLKSSFVKTYFKTKY